jgi:effector-binding domain-containing protein
MRTHQIEQRELVEQPTAVVRSAVSVAEIPAFMGRALGAVAKALAVEGLHPVGPPFARYHRIGDRRFGIEAGFPTSRAVPVHGEVVPASLPGGAAAVLTYLGPYEEMGAAYSALTEWVADRGAEPAGNPWEVYFTDPEEQPDPRRWRTEIVMPVRYLTDRAG